jgi:predicted enzyme related to lactoylglutathione lyase
MEASVTHFEIYAEEPGALADFYRALFGWQIEKAPGVDYYLIQTGAGAGGLRGGLTFKATCSNKNPPLQRVFGGACRDRTGDLRLAKRGGQGPAPPVRSHG